MSCFMQSDGTSFSFRSNLGFLFQPQYTYRLQHAQRTYRIRFRCVFGHVEAYFYMALCGQIINLVRLYGLYDTYQ